jgi:adenylate cyclase class IV
MNNEITLKITCDIKKFHSILSNMNFTPIEYFTLDDRYFVPTSLDLTTVSIRDILGKAIILRNIVDLTSNKNIIKLTFKNKTINENGVILKQSKTDCEILNLKEGESFLKAIGYKQLMQIEEKDTIYRKDNLLIATKDIKNGEKLIEVETVKNDNKLNTIEKLINEVKKLEMPLDTKDFFVKKAEIELKKIL